MVFSDSHKRHLLVMITHLDRMLAETAHELVSSADGQLFPAYLVDASPEQRRFIEERLVEFRRVARGFLDTHGIVWNRRPVSALWALQTALHSALEELDELAPRRLAAYGAVAAEDARAAEGVRAKLWAILVECLDFLRNDAAHADARPLPNQE